MNSEERRKRYQTDAEYRARVLEQQKARMPMILRQRKLRYRHDPAYREACKARASAYYASKRGAE